MTLLDVEHLVLHYQAGDRVVYAVDDVSFSIQDRGEAVGIVGESGSGKTSMAVALMRMLPKNVARFDGIIRLNDQDLFALDDEAFRREIRWSKIAMVFQGSMNVLNPVLRCGEQVAEPLLQRKLATRDEARERVTGLLERVGLPASIYERYPHELSGGQKQRVVIATALVLDPDLLILDEPTSALDVSVQAQIMNLLKDLKEDPGVSMLFITHDIGLASDLCDTMAVTYAGQHAEYGPADRVLVTPGHPYAQLLLESLPRLHDTERPKSMPGEPADLSDPPPGCRFHPRCPWVMSVCSLEDPPEFAMRDGGHVRCWLRDAVVVSHQDFAGTPVRSGP